MCKSNLRAANFCQLLHCSHGSPSLRLPDAGNMCWATVDIDADSPVNCKVQPQLEDGEFIQTFLLPLDNLYERLQARRLS